MRLTKEQIDIVIDNVLPKVGDNINEGQLQECIRSKSRIGLDVDDLEKLIDKMIEMGLIKRFDKVFYETTPLGYEAIEAGGWLKYLKAIKAEKWLDKEIKFLTVKQLKGNIFQMRWAWLFLLLSAIAGGLFGELFRILTGLIK